MYYYYISYNDLTGHKAAWIYKSGSNDVSCPNNVDTRIMTVSGLDKNYIYIASASVRLKHNEGYLSCSIGNGSTTYAYNGSEDQRGDFYPVNSLCAVIPNATAISVNATQRNGAGAIKSIDANIYILGIKFY